MHSTVSINVPTEGETAVGSCYLLTVRVSRKNKDFWGFLTTRQGHLDCSFFQMSQLAPENQYFLCSGFIFLRRTIIYYFLIVGIYLEVLLELLVSSSMKLQKIHQVVF